MSDGILRIVAGDEAALRIIVRQQRAEIDRLSAKVERLRMTQEERDAIERQADWIESRSRLAGEIWLQHLFSQEAATLRGLQARHARETVGGDSSAIADVCDS
jgi:hypothetical protein